MTKYTVSLDIGTTKIVAMVGSENQYGKIEILGVGKAKSLGVKKGLVSNLALTIQSIQEAVKQAQAAVGKEILISEVEVGIAGQHIHSTEHKVFIDRKQPESMISIDDLEALHQRVLKMSVLPGEEIIHILPQEYKIDDQEEIREPIGMAGSQLEAIFHIVLGQISSIKNIDRCVSSAGLQLKNLTLEPLASAAAVLNTDEKEAGVALIDIGGGTTDLAIFKDGIIRYTAVIPFGGNIITQDIKEGCSILEKHAEALKIQFGSAWPEATRENEIVSIPGLKGHPSREISIPFLSRIIKSRVEEIIGLVYNEIISYGHLEPKKQLIAGIVLTGGGSELKDIKQLVEYITAMPTRIGLPNEHLAAGTDEELSSPIYSTSIGLILTAIEKEKAKIREAMLLSQITPKTEEIKNQEVNLEIISPEPIEQNNTSIEIQEEDKSTEPENIQKEEEQKNTSSRKFFQKINDKIIQRTWRFLQDQ